MAIGRMTPEQWMAALDKLKDAGWDVSFLDHKVDQVRVQHELERLEAIERAKERRRAAMNALLERFENPTFQSW